MDQESGVKYLQIMANDFDSLSRDLHLALDFSDSEDSDVEEGLFTEDNEDCDSNIEEEEECEEEDAILDLAISREHAKANYNRAGTEVPEIVSNIKVEDFSNVMDHKIEKLFEDVVQEVKLPYEPAPFQRVATVALGGGKNVVMVMGTGEGKMTVTQLAALLIRKTHGHPKGVTIVTQPLKFLQLEQLTNPIVNTAVMTMAGRLTAGMGEEGGLKAVCDKYDFWTKFE